MSDTGEITACYAAGGVFGPTAVGGLVGEAYGTVTASYATGAVFGREGLGGLAGFSFFDRGVTPIVGTFNNTTFDNQTTGRLFGLGDEDKNENNVLDTDEVNTVPGQTTTYLLEQWSSGFGAPPADNFYGGWNVDLDNADGDDDLTTGGDRPWYFTDTEYPRLRVDFNGDGAPTYQEFGPQHENKPPIADAGDPQTVGRGTTVRLDGRRSYDPDDSGLIYVWTQTSGLRVTLSEERRSRPSFTAPNTDTTLEFSLRVIDGLPYGSAYSAATTTTVTVVAAANQRPTANAGDDRTVNSDTPVTLDGSGSRDDDGDRLTYRWTAPSGITLSSATAAMPTFTAPTSARILEFSLVVNDGSVNSEAATVTITVVERRPSTDGGQQQQQQQQQPQPQPQPAPAPATGNRPPAAPSLENQTAYAGQAFSYVFDEVRDPDGDRVKYRATLSNGDSLPGWLSFNVGTREFSGTPQADDAGAVSIQVRASDGQDSRSRHFTVTVVVPTPVPTATPLPTATPSPEPTATPSPTPVPLPTATPTPEPSPTPSPSPTPVPLPTATPRPEPTATARPTNTPTPVPLPTATATPADTPTPVPTPVPLPTATATPEPAPTARPASTATPIPTATPRPLPTATPEPAPTARPADTPTAVTPPTPTAQAEAAAEEEVGGGLCSLPSQAGPRTVDGATVALGLGLLGLAIGRRFRR